MRYITTLLLMTCCVLTACTTPVSKSSLAQINNSNYYTDGSSVYFGFNNENNRGFLNYGFNDYGEPEAVDVLDYKPFKGVRYTRKEFLEKFPVYKNRAISLGWLITTAAVKLPNVSLDGFTSINDNYGAYNGNVFYTIHQLDGATDKGFLVMKPPFAKDNKHVFYEHNALEGANPTKFQIIANDDSSYGNHSKDNKHVFYGSAVIEGANPATFKTLYDVNSGYGNHYSTDNKHVFYGSAVLEGANPKTFAMLDNEFTTDGASVYHFGRKLDNADASAFKLINHSYQKDNKHVWYHGKLTAIDARAFRILTDQYKQIDTIAYTADRDHVYYYGEVLPQADVRTFTLFKSDRSGRTYCLDRKNVFYENKVLDGANPRTFTLLGDNFSTDGVSVYHLDERLAHADASSFKVVNYTYQKDNKHVWNYGRLTKIDGSTFKILSVKDKPTETTEYTADKLHIYYQGEVIPQADVKNFTLLSSHNLYQVYGVDKEHVFYRGKVLEGADVNTFHVVLERDDSKPYSAYDKNYTYRRDERTKHTNDHGT